MASHRRLPPHARIALSTLLGGAAAGVCFAIGEVLCAGEGQESLRVLWSALAPVTALLAGGGAAGLLLPAAIGADERTVERILSARREGAAAADIAGQDRPSQEARRLLERLEAAGSRRSDGTQRREELLRRERSIRSARARELGLGVPLALLHTALALLVLLALTPISAALLQAAGGEGRLPDEAFRLLLSAAALHLLAALSLLVGTVVYRRIIESYLV